MDTNCSFKFPKTVDKVVDGIVTNDSNQFFIFTKTGMMIVCNIAYGKTKIYPPFNHNGTNVIDQIKAVCLYKHNIHMITRKLNILEHTLIRTAKVNLHYTNPLLTNSNLGFVIQNCKITCGGFIDATIVNANGTLCMHLKCV